MRGRMEKILEEQSWQGVAECEEELKEAEKKARRDSDKERTKAWKDWVQESWGRG